MISSVVDVFKTPIIDFAELYLIFTSENPFLIKFKISTSSFDSGISI